MSGLPSNPSKSVAALNPNFFGRIASGLKDVTEHEAKRIRQDSKPLLNKLETQWLALLKIWYPTVTIHAQEWRVRIGNGAWFKVDFCAFINGTWTAWECKGPKQGKNVDRGMLALKCAASQFPEVRWYLVWKENGHWSEQPVLP